jgi:hypothetical protein
MAYFGLREVAGSIGTASFLRVASVGINSFAETPEAGKSDIPSASKNPKRRNIRFEFLSRND